MIDFETNSYIEKFARHHEYFNEVPMFVRSPGRINLIGEHTDYNHGFALPASVGQSIYGAIGRSEDTDSCKLISLDYDETYEFNLSDLAKAKSGSWQNYCLGVVAELKKLGQPIFGFNLIIAGDIPQGSGMSSSAALECTTCFGLNQLFDLKLPLLQMAEICQRAEHNYVGVACGIMDQYASLFGKKNHALLLDCENLKHEYRKLKFGNHLIVLCNSNVKHNLSDSAYNDRRAQCEEGVVIIQKQDSQVVSLRDVSMELLNQCRNSLPEIVYRRCRYVLKENERVLLFSKAISEGHVKAAGALLAVAQRAMREEYEITCPEIDFMTDFANKHESVAGSRMMGGGFGGCTINLVEKEQKDRFCEELDHSYRKQFGIAFSPIPITIENGSSIID